MKSLKPSKTVSDPVLKIPKNLAPDMNFNILCIWEKDGYLHFATKIPQIMKTQGKGC